jgi:hypothetical protein
MEKQEYTIYKHCMNFNDGSIDTYYLFSDIPQRSTIGGIPTTIKGLFIATDRKAINRARKIMKDKTAKIIIKKL